jgi:hypothetical protein
MASQNTQFNTQLINPSFSVSEHPMDTCYNEWLEVWRLMQAQQNSSNKRPRDEDGGWSTSSSQKRQNVNSSIQSPSAVPIAPQTTATSQQTSSQPSSSTVLGKHARDSSCSSEQFLQSERVAKRQDLDMPGNPSTAVVLCPNPQPIAASGTNGVVAKPNPNMWLIMDDCMAASPNRSEEFEDLYKYGTRYSSLFSLPYIWQ